MLDAGNREGNLEAVALELSPAWLEAFPVVVEAGTGEPKAHKAWL